MIKSTLNKKIIANLYFQILRIRMVEEAIASEYKKQEMRCPVHLCIGQEAIAAGVCADLKKEDVVFSSHRSHGHFLAKGGNLKKMVAEIYGKKTGCCLGRGGSQHLIDLSVNFYGSTPIVGGTIPVAVGAAWAVKLKNEKKIVAVFFGDGATDEGVFHESLTFASLKKLPILFVCENNNYSIFTHISDRQPVRSLQAFAESYKIQSFQEDGNDVLKTYETVAKATNSIKDGNGPVFIEFLTYRMKEHCGPDEVESGLRPEKEYQLWKKKDPVRFVEKYLLDNKLLGEKDLVGYKKKISAEIEDAFEFGKTSPFPDETPDVGQVYK